MSDGVRTCADKPSLSSNVAATDHEAAAGAQTRSSEVEKFGERSIPEGMSKNQWKKVLKRQKMEQGRAEWR